MLVASTSIGNLNLSIDIPKKGYTMFELTFFAFSGVAYAVFLLAVIVIGIVASERDSFFLGTVTMIGAAIGLDVLFDVPVWDTIKTNPWMAVIYVIAYVLAGSAYTGMWEWPEYIRSKSSYIKSAYDEWAARQKRNNCDADHELFLNSDAYTFKARKNKQRLAAWVLLWPFSMAWALSHRPAMWMFNQVYTVLGEMFENVSRRTARKILDKNV